MLYESYEFYIIQPADVQYLNLICKSISIKKNLNKKKKKRETHRVSRRQVQVYYFSIKKFMQFDKWLR